MFCCPSQMNFIININIIYNDSKLIPIFVMFKGSCQTQRKRDMILLTGVNGGRWNTYADYCGTVLGGKLIRFDKPALNAFKYFSRKDSGRIFDNTW